MASADGILRVPPTVDVQEFLAERGLSDGLPVVPPTRAKLRWMLSSTNRQAEEVLGKVAPSLTELTVERAAVSAVMAGCTPRQFPVVLAAAEAMLEPQFNLHGVHATTMGASVAVIVNGPARHEAAINCGLGVLGSGTRSNATVGRALKLILQNVGGSKLGGTESTTIGGPAKFTLCMGEKEESLGSWEPLSTSMDSSRRPGESWVTVRAVSSGPEQLVDFDTLDADDLVEKMASKASQAWASHMPLINETLVVISPEHAHTLQKGGYKSKAQLQQALFDASNMVLAANIHKVGKTIVQMSAKIPTAIKPALGELAGSVMWGFTNLLNLLVPFSARSRGCSAIWAVVTFRILKSHLSMKLATAIILLLMVSQSRIRRVARAVQATLPKFTSPGSFHIVVAGAEAGKFSSFMPGFGCGVRPMPTAFMSSAVSRRVATPLETSPAPPPEDRSDELVDPRVSKLQTSVLRAPRKQYGGVSLEGTVGLLDISKHGGGIMLDQVQRRFEQRCGGKVRCIRYCKPMFSRPCPEDLRKQIASECDYMIEALAD